MKRSSEDVIHAGLTRSRTLEPVSNDFGCQNRKNLIRLELKFELNQFRVLRMVRITFGRRIGPSALSTRLTPRETPPFACKQISCFWFFRDIKDDGSRQRLSKEERLRRRHRGPASREQRHLRAQDGLRPAKVSFEKTEKVQKHRSGATDHPAARRAGPHHPLQPGDAPLPSIYTFSPQNLPFPLIICPFLSKSTLSPLP
jgi:hypothetical protein